MLEDLVDPVRVEGHVDEDGGLVGPCTAPAVHAHAHDHLNLPVLAHQGPAVVSLADALVLASACADLVGTDVEVSFVQVLTAFVIDDGKVDRFENLVVSRSFGLSPAVHAAHGAFRDGAAEHGQLDSVDTVCGKSRFGEPYEGQVGPVWAADHVGDADFLSSRPIRSSLLDAGDAQPHSVLAQVRDT